MKVICKLVGRWEIKRPIADPLGISSLSEYKGSRQENQLGRVVGQREQVVLTCPWRTFESHHLSSVASDLPRDKTRHIKCEF